MVYCITVSCFKILIHSLSNSKQLFHPLCIIPQPFNLQVVYMFREMNSQVTVKWMIKVIINNTLQLKQDLYPLDVMPSSSNKINNNHCIKLNQNSGHVPRLLHLLNKYSDAKIAQISSNISLMRRMHTSKILRTAEKFLKINLLKYLSFHLQPVFWLISFRKLCLLVCSHCNLHFYLLHGWTFRNYIDYQTSCLGHRQFIPQLFQNVQFPRTEKLFITHGT